MSTAIIVSFRLPSQLNLMCRNAAALQSVSNFGDGSDAGDVRAANVCMRMFEDGPPPLPRRASTESSSDTAAVADLDDENRLTAVADEDGGEIAGNLRMTFFSEQDLSLREFVDVDAQQQQQQPLCLDLSESVAVEGESRQATGGGGDILDASIVGADEAVQGSADALSVEGTAPANGSERCEKEEEDEFGDFEECVAIERNANSSWANFETVGIEKHITSGDQSSPLKEELAELRLPSLEANSSGSSTESALANCFVSDQLWVNDSDRGDVIEENDEQAFSGAGIYESLNGTEKTNSSNAGPDKLVWLAVSIIEEALALKLQWQESTVRKDFLESLNIDANRVGFLLSVMLLLNFSSD
ncbi:unnamed protein product [Gongylonema pulchrum]|uniref:Clathrin_bdg domain-containing protein n=1 Tax=Gongylonema pulchrum TaxID=637853 RepID=A0A183EA69_9BILA|nr:unnamed protein product [Gongylonema pulchrum]